MAIRDLRDVQQAYAEGRWHTQRFFKNSLTTGSDGVWYDWSYASGQPAYDARVGAANTLTPVVAQRNDAIYFPPIDAGMERRLAGMTFQTAASGSAQTNVECWLYDLVAYYPLIDGDSTDQQVFDNTASMPRYTDGAGVRAVLVNHVAPQTGSGGTHTMEYVDADGATQTANFGIQNNGLNRVNTRVIGASAGATADLYMALPGRGVRRINWVQFGTTPGGLLCIYLVKPVAFISHRAGADIQNNPVMTEVCLCSERSFDLPVIPDGASLGLFTLTNGSSRTITQINGTCRFIWG